MPKRAASAEVEKEVMNPLIIAQQFTIAGYACKTPQVIQVETLNHEGRDVHMARVCKSEPWLSRVIAGTSVSVRPLARSVILDELRARLRMTQNDMGPKDKMRDLDYDSEDERSSKSPYKGKTSLVQDGIVVAMDVNTSSASAEKVSVKVASIKKKLHIDIRNLPWLISYMREEVRLQGVPEIEPASNTQQQSRITFNFRDESYTARVLLRNGKSQKRVSFLKGRMKSDGDLSHLSRDQACQILMDELKEWQNQILTADGQMAPDQPGK